MLQIISGKFFKEGSERHAADCKGITYSNCSWLPRIETCVATIEPAEVGMLSTAAYVIGYRNQIEKETRPGCRDILVQVGDEEIVQQFQLLCIFWFKAFFDADRAFVELMCRQKRRDSSDEFLPAVFVPDFFKERKSTPEDWEAFKAFVSQVIGLRRKQYQSVVVCLENFADALRVLNYNFDLAYSMLVYCLESLSQTFDGYEPVWEHYEEKVRLPLDEILEKLDAKDSGKLRGVLLSSAHLKLTRRFVDFCRSHVEDDYFTGSATGLTSALRKSELERALLNAYIVRSKFTHQLLVVREQIKIPIIAQGDTFHWDSEPYLTLRGLCRLVHHVILNFIRKQEIVPREEFPWRNDLPGQVLFPLSPEYWIGKLPEMFTSDQAARRFSAFLVHVQSLFMGGKGITDLRGLIKRMETLISSAKADEKRSMLAMHFLFNWIVEPNSQTPDFKIFLNKHEKELNELSLESMLLHMITEQKWDWPVADCIREFDRYWRSKYSKETLTIPVFLEVGLLLEIGNLLLDKGDQSGYRNYYERAVLEAAGFPEPQQVIRESVAKAEKIKSRKVWMKSAEKKP